jgi:hypothetical protein
MIQRKSENLTNVVSFDNLHVSIQKISLPCSRGIDYRLNYRFFSLWILVVTL